MRLQRSVGPDDQEKANAAVEAQADEAPIEDTAPALDAETRSHKYLTTCSVTYFCHRYTPSTIYSN